MTANMYAWEPRMGLDPKRKTFEDDVYRLCDPDQLQPPSDNMRDFVQALLARYPELSEETAEDTVWADAPLIGNANDGFINVSIVWPRFDEAQPVFVAIARVHGLHAYDPQDEKLYLP